MVIITGATGGIAKPLAEKIILSEMACCAVVRNVERLNKSTFSLCSSKLTITDYQIDSFIKLLSGIDKSQILNIILVLNAFDIHPIKMAEKLTSGDITKNVEFNIIKQIEIVNKAWELAAHTATPLRIVNLDSGAAYRPISGWSMYCAGKAYINMFLKVFSQENEVPLVLYDPGIVNTKMQEEIRSTNIQDFPSVEVFRNYYLSKKLNSPIDVAEDILTRYIIDWTAVELCEGYADR